MKGRGEVTGKGRLERREKEEKVEVGGGGGGVGRRGGEKRRGGRRVREGRRESWEGGGLTTTISKQSLDPQVETIV